MATIVHPTRFFRESDMHQPELIDVAGGHIVAFSKTCPGKTEPNDDSALVISLSADRFVMAVADGVGGAPLGYKASAIAIECLAETLSESFAGAGDAVVDQLDLRPAILDGIEKANAEILDLGTGSATTLSIVEVNHRIARGYQVGDSMMLFVGGRGAIKWKSTSHSPVGYAVQAGLMDEEDAMYHDERHLVSNLVGSREMHIEIGPAINLSARDTIVVGSDGLFDNLHTNEVVQRCRIGKPGRRMEELVRLATDRMHGEDDALPGKFDDLTILLLTP
ncbi:PP2C family protein-serine/threonine phosphatase [Roseiconus lacunae]|uniref:Protein phosphatase 2C domain-containing protein n=1 Tax=Roseiconus lacunae TaxID=2605694 RepID=A0ABT7PCI9_9BACT|nr:protein phosphatase 2C domain-containing protein [Roseiconus lacunae]MCD0458992.1 protein phosphatase 2C domain-containing protein [Roseiconus lacunae]MDM4014192.1 protein phosphatase 2C domain-containing protein [Roseiconus lacunae]WRQ53488.1 protein phosphatase 2C domain-containing protein [Stieleria sp. HD01]